MPIFGDPSRFAIEYDIDENHGDEWMLGRICCWCGGQRIGDYDLGTSLRDVLFQFDHLTYNNRHRFNQRFSSMPAAATFQLLDATLFGAADPNDMRLADEEQWARYKILPSVDVFDHWKGFLIEDGQAARLIFACDPYLDIKELFLKSGEADAVLNITRDVLNAVHESR